MRDSSSPSSKPTSTAEGGYSVLRVLAVVILAVTAFTAHFLHFRHLGLYEDDYWSIANTYNSSLSHLKAIAIYDFTQWPTGRPLNHLLPSVLSVVGYRLGGLHAMYLIAAGWLSLNAILVYAIARRFLGPTAALLTGLAYILYPADTTKELLIHASHIQGAMTFLLFGLYLWLAGGWRRALAYPVAGLSLLSYETAFIPFMLAPLLELAIGGSRRRREWIQHGAGCAVILGIIVYFRLKTGDSRSVAVLGEPGQDIYRALTSLYLGPLTGLRAFGHAFMEGARHLNATVFVGGGLVLALGVLYARMSNGANVRAPEAAGGAPSLLTLSAACIVTWSASYLLTLVNYPPTQIEGRFTSTHIAAGWPVALLCGCLCEWLLQKRGWLATASRFAIPAALALLLSHALYIQANYESVWRVEQSFWRQVLMLCPDVDVHTDIIVTGTPDPRRSPVIMANSWADYHACVHLYGLDKDNNGPRFAHLGVMGSTIQFEKKDGGIFWNPEFWSGSFVHLNPADLILLVSNEGRLTRVTSIAVPMGVLTTTKPIPNHAAPAHPGTFLYQLFTQE